ncbi:unnamed protein product [Effrenium voratum]|uniref:EF-hand domain-containing protein n=1 Tax=Effrenium voratum TaxID=2562239 RepID=A0AA36JTR2_9DINO|nr:unnamed protein product [Effrenium voratum]
MAAEAPLISAEREMLEAVASDDAERAAGLMRSDAMTAQLLKLRVRPTYHDATATEAFFHSVASYGLSFGLGENITQLAKRNGATDVLAILQNVEVRLGLDAARRIEAEAELLSIIRSKNRRKLLQFLRTCPIIDELLKAQVKASYHDAKDKEAVYHSLASYELNFAIGESLREVALRNGCCMADDFLPPEVQDEAPAAPAPPMATGDLRVVLTSAMTGEAICSLDAGRQWTLAMLARAANSSAPAKGCRVFLRGSAALTAGTVLADLAEEEASLELATLVVANVEGKYTAGVPGREDHLDLGPGRLAGLGGLGGLGRGRRARDGRLELDLKADGSAHMEYQVFPVDRGHCAGSSGGCWVSANGRWEFDAGVAIRFSSGRKGRFDRGRASDDGGTWQEHQMQLSMPQEGQLQAAWERLYASPRRDHFGEGVRRRAHQEWFLSLAGREAQVPLNRRQLENAFKLYDFDGTGSISKPNLRKVLASLFGILPDAGERVLQQSFGTKVEITLRDFISLYLDSVKVAGLPGLEDLREAFDLFDQDKNGTLDLKELLHAFEQCAPTTVPSADITELFNAIDVNKDGTIDLAEMIHFLAKTWTDGFHLAR